MHTVMRRALYVAGVVLGVLFWTSFEWYYGILAFVVLVVIAPAIDEPAATGPSRTRRGVGP
jgi:hypothetical protein